MKIKKLKALVINVIVSYISVLPPDQKHFISGSYLDLRQANTGQNRLFSSKNKFLKTEQ